jgi:hypothetical protein
MERFDNLRATDGEVQESRDASDIATPRDPRRLLIPRPHEAHAAPPESLFSTDGIYELERE